MNTSGGNQRILEKEYDKLCSIQSEAGVIASIVRHPEWVFRAEELAPAQFYDKSNGYIYRSVVDLVNRGVKNIDTYNLLESIQSFDDRAEVAKLIDKNRLDSLVAVSGTLARNSESEFDVAVRNVKEFAFRREMLITLDECKTICYREVDSDVEREVYERIDDVLTKYSATDMAIPYKDVVRDRWAEIKKRQNDGFSGIPFDFPTLNNFCTMESGELIVFGAEQKQGKSMLLLNIAVSLLKKGKSVVYIDSELNDRLFTARLIARLTGIEFRKVNAGGYTQDQEDLIQKAIAWMEQKNFYHIYLPSFDSNAVYAIVKKLYHSVGIDVVVVDYLKSNSDGDAFATYQEMGRFTDMIKNKCCGALNICGIAAAQATSSGKLADSAKIARNASTIIMLSDKTPEEMAIGKEFGNKKAKVVFNRNGPQHSDGEWIDMRFDGNHILYEEAKQHVPEMPY